MCRKKNKLQIKCALCSKEFLIRPENIGKNNWCSKPCFAKYKKSILKKSNSLCFCCGKEFYRKPSAKKTTKEYCTKKCFSISKIGKKFNTDCLKCGKEIYKKPNQIKKGNCYCSRICSLNDRKKQTNFNVSCKTCGKKIHKKPSQIKKTKFHFCSITCLDDHRKNQKKIPCTNCNNLIIRSKCKYDKNKKNFCNRKCFGEWISKNIFGTNHPRTYIQKKICPMCKIEFKPAYNKKKYCSNLCSNKSKNRRILCECCFCKKQYEKIPSEIKWSKIRNYKYNYCSRECAKKHKIKENHPLWKEDRSKIKNQNKTIRFSFDMNYWRKYVFARDNWECQLCSNRSKKDNKVILNAHHIKKYAEFPDMRFNVNNGITLCEKCHKSTYKKEHTYEKLFKTIIGDKYEKEKSK